MAARLEVWIYDEGICSLHFKTCLVALDIVRGSRVTVMVMVLVMAPHLNDFQAMRLQGHLGCKAGHVRIHAAHHGRDGRLMLAEGERVGHITACIITLIKK